MDRKKAMIFPKLYWSGIRYVVQKEVNNVALANVKKWSNIEYDKLPAKKVE